MDNPFGDLIGLRLLARDSGSCRYALTVDARHLNPHRVVHGAVLYALADTGMGVALYPTLAEGELCATIEIKMNYFKPVTGGEIVCTSTLVNRGRTVANLESRLLVGDVLVATANGHYAIFTPRRPLAR